MSSRRDKIRKTNDATLKDNSTSYNSQKTLVNDILDNYINHAEAEEQRDIEKEIDKIAESIPEPEIKNPEPKKETEKGKGGRPIKYTEEIKTVTVRLTKSNYEFARRNGWEFGGYTGYINHLIEEKRGLNK